MATISRNKLNSSARFGGVPYGNSASLPFKVVTASNGALFDSDTSTGIASGDKVRIGVLEAGTQLIDALTIVSTGFTATVTGSLGFEYVDGVDSADVPQNATYFGTGITLATAGRYRASNNAVAVVTLPKDAYLILTTAVAANAKAAVVDVVIDAILKGAP